MTSPDLETLHISPQPEKGFPYVGSLLPSNIALLGMVRWEGSDPGALVLSKQMLWAHREADTITPLPVGTDCLWLHKMAESRGHDLVVMTALSEAAEQSFAQMWEGEKALSLIVVKRLMRAFHLPLTI